jgi:DNA-binding MarR family transcriptional regulator
MPTSPPAARSPAATPASAVEAVRSLARASRILERASGELGLAHYRVLSAIAAGEDRASRVAERFELGRPTISAAVDALRRAGLIERAEVEADQRAFALRLTPSGRETLGRVETEMVRVLEELCGRLSCAFPPGTGALDVLAALGGALDARAQEHHAPRPAGRPAAPSSSPS